MVPGPGTYAQKNAEGGAKISLSSRAVPLRKDVIPGPGQYNTGGQFSENMKPKASFSGRTDIFKQNQNPAPGEYEFTPSMSKHGAALASRHEKGSKLHVPGPGEYNPHPVYTAVPQSSMASRH